MKRGEGLELEQVQIEGFNPDPAILDDISDPIYKAWVSIVNSYWTLLIRYVNAQPKLSIQQAR
jgi:alpha,alpha-trehalase